MASGRLPAGSARRRAGKRHPHAVHDPYMDSLLKEAVAPPRPHPVGRATETDDRRLAGQRPPSTPAPTLVFPPVAGERRPGHAREGDRGNAEPLENSKRRRREKPRRNAIVAVVNAAACRANESGRVENFCGLRGLQPARRI
jgi:hypothetical protein